MQVGYNWQVFKTWDIACSQGLLVSSCVWQHFLLLLHTHLITGDTSNSIEADLDYGNTVSIVQVNHTCFTVGGSMTYGRKDMVGMTITDTEVDTVTRTTAAATKTDMKIRITMETNTMKTDMDECQIKFLKFLVSLGGLPFMKCFWYVLFKTKLLHCTEHLYVFFFILIFTNHVVMSPKFAYSHCSPYGINKHF